MAKEKKEQVAYYIKPSFKKKMEEQAEKEDKSLNGFMEDIHINYMKRKKQL